MKPYTQHNVDQNTFVRTFDDSIDEQHLKWHVDESNRLVQVVENVDWMIQFDDCLPVLLQGDVYIPKNMYHRVIKGVGNLIVKITEYDDNTSCK
jgi:hypothetical protein